MNIIKTTCAAVLILAAAASQAAPDPAKLSGNPTGERTPAPPATGRTGN